VGVGTFQLTGPSATPGRRSRWRSIRQRPSRAASWPPTPAGRSPTPGSPCDPASAHLPPSR
jgi:hypothetical protein